MTVYCAYNVITPDSVIQNIKLSGASKSLRAPGQDANVVTGSEPATVQVLNGCVAEVR